MSINSAKGKFPKIKGIQKSAGLHHVYTGIFWLIIHINRIFKWAITISLILDIYISKSVKNNSLPLKAMVGSYLLTVLPAISESILLCIKIEGPGLDKRLGWQSFM